MIAQRVEAQDVEGYLLMVEQGEASITRLIGAVLLEQNDEWLLQCRYMQIEGMAELTPPLIDADPAKLPPMAA
jgi:putative transposase